MSKKAFYITKYNRQNTLAHAAKHEMHATHDDDEDHEEESQAPRSDLDFELALEKGLATSEGLVSIELAVSDMLGYTLHRHQLVAA
ncbi:MAG: hypothetical protein DI585_02085 [Pseudomonas fluorescens]|nr:MAG: hypothetical protein DI585_02085 [Pseudomonas fluorescens]